MAYEWTWLSQFLRPCHDYSFAPVNSYNVFSPRWAAYTQPNQNPKHGPDTIQGFN